MDALLQEIYSMSKEAMDECSRCIACVRTLVVRVFDGCVP